MRSSDAPVAVVAAVQVFPVKSLGAVPAASIVVDDGGAVGDRGHAVVDETGDLVTAEHEPRLRQVRAALDGHSPRLDVPGADPGLAGRPADSALSAFLGRPVQVQPVPRGAQLDAPVHVVSLQSVDAALRGEHSLADCACSTEEPRANLVIDLAPSRAGTGREDGWVGRLVEVGPALLRLSRRPGHCLGVYAEVLRGGQLRPGDPLRLLADEPATAGPGAAATTART